MGNPSSMTPERWQRLQVLFDRALELDPQARAEFVVAECGEDLSLREQLLSLIMASATDDDRFEERVDGAIASMMLRDAELSPGHRIGHYKIVRLIGRGGMGAVYLAERADLEFDQSVAIKVVADGALSHRIVARLRSERQILANLNHPNIARLLDGGATQDGTPFLVMEYVDGQRLDRYCEERRLSIPQKLRLFQQVCAAVQYAHQNLVVHRDIKPSNILVTADGTPKLLDFGIAKLVDPNATTQGLALTRIHERVLTPEHASPEQVRGERVGTVSDVYALGVLMYELLSGLKPFNFIGLSFDQIEKTICEVEPPKPSAAVLAASKLDIPTAEASLGKELAGDLDTLILKAMHKDPDRRYGSAGALSYDIENFLSRRPIAGRPDNFTYRARKFWERNRWAMATSIGVVLLVAGLTVIYTWRLVQERNAAESERRTAQEISEFMQGVFDLADPTEARGNAITVREALDAAVIRIDSELKDQPRARADLLLAMTRAYRGIGLWKQGLELAKKTVAQERDAFGNSHVELAYALNIMADVHFVLSQHALAQPLLDEAWTIRDNLGLTHDLDAAHLLTSIGGNLRAQSRYEEALQFLDRAEKTIGMLSVPHAAELARVAQTRAYTELQMGRFADAEKNARRALALLVDHTEHEGINWYDNATDTLIQSLRRQNRFEEAESQGRAMLADQLKRLSEDSPLIARTRNNLSHMLRARGNYSGAEELLRGAILSFDKRLGPENFDSATSYHNLGALLREAGQTQAAELALERSLFLKRKLAGDQHPSTLSTLVELAMLVTERKELPKAEKLLREAEAVAETKLPAEDLRRGLVLFARGRIALAGGRFDEAQRYLSEAEERFDASDALSRSNVQYWRGELELLRGNACNAKSILRQSLELRRPMVPSGHIHISSTENSLGVAMLRCGEEAEGTRMLDASLDRMRSTRPKGDYFLSKALERAAMLEVRASTKP